MLLTTGVKTLSLPSINGGHFYLITMSLSPAWHTKKYYQSDAQVSNAWMVQGFILIHVLNSRSAGQGELSGVDTGTPILRSILFKSSAEGTNLSASEAPPDAVCLIAILNS